VSGPHVEDDPDLGLRDPGEVGDVAYPPGAHLENKICRGRRDPADGQRYADLGVERADVGDRLAMALQHRPQQVLRACLSRGSRDADDDSLGSAFHEGMGQSDERCLNVLDHDRWQVSHWP
jgi:hypothetical protein